MTPLINADGRPTGHVLVARDITHQTRLEAEQAALRERLGCIRSADEDVSRLIDTVPLGTPVVVKP